MALTAGHVSDVPNLDQVPETTTTSLSSLFSPRFSKGADVGRIGVKPRKFLVVGHRGSGMNSLQSSDRRMKAFKENSILSFNSAARFPVDFVTKDDCPVIFHDNFILSEENGTLSEKSVTELSLSEFLCYGPQREPSKVGKSLFRKAKDGEILSWNVERDDSLCTLEEAFQKVNSSLGFNVELKFDDRIVYQQEHLVHALQSVLKVFFLTNGGNEIYYDVRRNSLEEGVKLCVEGGLQGIVSEVKGILRNPGAVSKIKEAKLSLLTFGKLNNVPEAVHLQHLMGIEGVIVDLVQEITEAVSEMIKPLKEQGGEEILMEREEQIRAKAKPQFMENELSFLLKLVPELNS
ncbi:hypothetical protein RHGRI_022714 [Rhododendron griersonianum]|uniref:glycerophosphodiester phosphodiesterase n=1 Tax=Rhododendron griersonianum TaxID=479676 RepID=A0AAV6J680_9ERIC|nr:hypothetical protein RHGRI_022714 [Rhododendron griersonianum]